MILEVTGDQIALLNDTDLRTLVADTLETRMPLFDALKQHPKAEIAAWANEHAPVFAAYIANQRVHEAKEDSARDQTFE
ncbi:MAG: hypothetical protein V4573_16990 [Pseudomonadota bacterium]|uniref:hypothetical protein n=1 Tax=Polaromonas sp. YR568 TaxID=1855301 RepID=UPI0027195F6F|nr:hypothetical protein [Polaromonas sp.]